MKTTVELSDTLLSELKERARVEETTMKELMETAIRRYLESARSAEHGYRFENHSFKGTGVCEGIEEGSWEHIRGMIYEGRGG